MCEGSASFAVDRDGVEGACGEREVLPVGLLTRPRSDRGRSCERVSVLELRFGSINLKGMMSVFLHLERSEPTTWEVTSAWVQKHNLSTMLSK